MIEIITHEGAITLDLSPETTIPVTENSKGFDSNNFAFDFTSNVNLPYSSSNVKALHKFGMEQFKVILKSDGVFIADYYARIVENKLNLNTYTGTLTLELNSLFKDLNDKASDTNLRDAFTYNELVDATTVDNGDLLDTTEPKLHALYRMWQANPNLNKPYRFPEYHLQRDLYGSEKELYKPNFEDTVQDDFGNAVNVNHLNNSYAPEPPEYNSTTNIAPPGTVFPQDRIDDWSIKWLILYDRNGREPYNAGWGSPVVLTVDLNQTRVSRRLWGIVSPCFFYLYVLETSLNNLGYKVKFDFDTDSDEEFFKKIVILNNHNIYQTIIGREEGYYDYVNGTPDAGYFSRNNVLSVANILEIEGKNHVPDISVLDLLVDFKAKSNFNLEIEGGTLVFKSIQIKQSELKQVFDPNISTSQVEILNDKILKYNYTEADYIENIPDYRINLGNKNTDDITSDMVPVYIRREDQLNPINKWYYPYIIGSPSFDESTKSFITYVVDEAIIQFTPSDPPTQFLGTVSYIGYPIEFPELGIDTENLSSYVVQSCPLFCALTQYRDAYYPSIGTNALFHLYYTSGVPSQIFGYVCIADQHLSTPTDIIRTLRWETEEGLFETMYLRTIDILKAKFVVKLKAAMTIEAWNKFSHYHFFSLTGKKLFPLLREYTLPFSKNSQVKMECYEVE
jgi:hypothetical protein